MLMYTASFFSHAFSPGLLSPLRRVFARDVRPALHDGMLNGGERWQQKLDGRDFAVFSYNAAPLLWVSGSNARGMGWFQAFFDSLGLPEINGQAPQLYCGFFVISHHAPACLWHDDYTVFANAYTLLPPLYPLCEDHGHLLYYPTAPEHSSTAPEKSSQKPLRYTYTEGESLIIGHGLQHTTEPYRSQHLRVLVSLTFGGQDMQYWPQLKPVLKGQSFFYRKPCGHLSNQLCLCALQHTGFQF
mgnify:CR=1 FL=1